MPLESREDGLREFFSAYEARTNRALASPDTMDIDATAAAFADCFVAANPHGVACGKNDQALREGITKGFDFYRSIGTKSMNILSLQITELDLQHALVKVNWRAAYVKHDGTHTEITFDVFYFLQHIAEQWRIFAYITGDEQAAYRQHGLLSQ